MAFSNRFSKSDQQELQPKNHSAQHNFHSLRDASLLSNGRDSERFREGGQLEIKRDQRILQSLPRPDLDREREEHVNVSRLLDFQENDRFSTRRNNNGHVQQDITLRTNMDPSDRFLRNNQRPKMVVSGDAASAPSPTGINPKNNLASSSRTPISSLGELTKNDLRSHADVEANTSLDSVGLEPDRLIQRLVQIREYISQANQMVTNMLSLPANSKSHRRLAKIRTLITELKDQENGYMKLLTNYLGSDDGDIGPEEDDDTTIDIVDDDRSEVSEPPIEVVFSPTQRPLIEDRLGSCTSSSIGDALSSSASPIIWSSNLPSGEESDAATLPGEPRERPVHAMSKRNDGFDLSASHQPTSPTDENGTLDESCEELEDLKRQRDILRNILQKQTDLRKHLDHQRLTECTEVEETGDKVTPPAAPGRQKRTDRRPDTEGPSPSLGQRGSRPTSSDLPRWVDTSLHRGADRPTSCSNGAGVAPAITQNRDLRRMSNSSSTTSSSSQQVSAAVHKNDHPVLRPVGDSSQASLSGEEGGDDALMATAIPRELLEMRRQLEFLRNKQAEVDAMHVQFDSTQAPRTRPDEQASSIVSSESSKGSQELGTAAVDTLVQTKNDLFERLSTLQDKKDQIDDLLEQLEILRASRAEQDGEAGVEDEEGSTSSSQVQLYDTRATIESATDTAEEAQDVISAMDSQGKLQKLQEVRQRLSHLRDMMSYYQSATQFIHGPPPDGQDLDTYSRPKDRTNGETSRQRLLDYGSSVPSSQTSDTESASLQSDNDSLRRKVVEKRGSLQDLRSLMQYLQSGRPLDRLSAEQISLLQSIVDSGAEEAPNASNAEGSLNSVVLGSEPGELVLRGSSSHPPPQAAPTDVVSYREVIEDQERELSQLVNEKEQLLSLQGQWERLHASVTPQQPSDQRRTQQPGHQQISTGPRLHTSTGNHWTPSATAADLQGKSQRDSETLQEQQLGKFVANEEVYENMRAERMWREELRQKKAEIAQMVEKERSNNAAYTKNQRGGNSSRQSDLQDSTTPTACNGGGGTTAATWGSSTESTTWALEDDQPIVVVDVHARDHPQHKASYLVEEEEEGDEDEDEILQQVEEEEEEADLHAGSPSLFVTSGPSSSRRKHQQQQPPFGSHVFPLGLEARARVITNNQQQSAAAAQHAQSLSYPASQQMYQTPSLFAPQTAMSPLIWGPQYLCDQSMQMMTEMMSIQQQMAATLGSLYSSPAGMIQPTPTNNSAVSPRVGPPQGYPHMAPMPHQPFQAWPASAGQQGPPLNVVHQQARPREAPPQPVIGRAFGQEKRESAAKLASKRQKPYSDIARHNEASYRPGLSAGISGTAFDSASEVDSVDGRNGGRQYREMQSMLDRSERQLLGANNSRSSRFASTNSTIYPDGAANTTDVSQFEALRETIYAEVAALISQNEGRPNYLIELFRELQHLSSDYLRQRTLYLVHDLITKSLTKQVLGMAAQAPRSKAYTQTNPPEEIDETPSESLAGTEEDSDQDNFSDASLGQLYTAALDHLDKKTSRIMQQSGGPAPSIQTLPATDLRLASSFPANKNSPRSDAAKSQPQDQKKQHRAYSPKDDSVDYVESASSTSTLSTPVPSTFVTSGDAVPDSFTQLDKTLQMLRDIEQSQSRSTVEELRKRLQSDNVSESSLSEIAGPNLDSQLLEEQIKEVIHFLIPVLKEHQAGVYTPQLVIWTRDATIDRVMQIMGPLLSRATRPPFEDDGAAGTSAAGGKSDQEFNRFFYKQLSTQLCETLTKYEGKRISTIIEDLMVDVSEMLFNELAFFRLITDLDAARSGLTSEADSEDPEVTAKELEQGERTLSAPKGQLDAEVSDGHYSDEFDTEEMEEEFQDDETEEDDFDEKDDNEALNQNHHELMSSLSVALAPSETKPMTRIGSDEDEDDEDMMEEDGDDDWAETAVARSASSLAGEVMDPVIVDAEEKDAALGSGNEKHGRGVNQMHSTQLTQRSIQEVDGQNEELVEEVSPHLETKDEEVSPHLETKDEEVSPHLETKDEEVSPHLETKDEEVSPHLETKNEDDDEDLTVDQLPTNLDLSPLVSTAKEGAEDGLVCTNTILASLEGMEELATPPDTLPAPNTGEEKMHSDRSSDE